MNGIAYLVEGPVNGQASNSEFSGIQMVIYRHDATGRLDVTEEKKVITVMTKHLI